MPIAMVTRSTARPSEVSTHAAARSSAPRATAPVRSKRVVTCGAREGMTRHASANAAAQTGTFTRKIQRQSIAASTPPTSGPTVAPTPAAALTIPNSAPRRPLGSASRSSPRPFGTSAEAAMACCSRHTASSTMEEQIADRDRNRQPARWHGAILGGAATDERDQHPDLARIRVVGRAELLAQQPLLGTRADDEDRQNDDERAGAEQQISRR